MRKMKARSKWLLPFFALLLVLAGCQTVGGLDVNKALLGDLDVKSSESSMTFSLNAEPAEGISAEDKEIVDLMNSFSLGVSNAKLQDNGNMSVQGTIGFKQYNIPFSVFMDKETLVFTVKGAKQSFFYPIEGYEEIFGTEELDSATTNELSKLLTKFVVENLPNPGAISVTPVTEAVNGQPLNLTKLHTEVTGEELPALLKAFLKSISKDTEGFTELISGLYDYLYPVLNDMGVDSDDLLFLGLGEIPLEDKEGVVTVLHDVAKLAIDTVLLVYDKQVDNLYETVPEIQTVLSKDTKLQVDIFLDSGLHVRKQNVALKVALPASDDVPLKSISLKAESQVWNVNGPVTADVISTTGGLNIATAELTPGELMRAFEEGSDVYRILMEDIAITKKSIVIAPDDEYYYPIVKGNVTYAPLRFIAESLDASVEWNPANSSIHVTDDIYGDNLVFKAGSSNVLINGKNVKIEHPVFFDEYGYTYVPLRLLAESLHATVTKDEDGWIYLERN